MPEVYRNFDPLDPLPANWTDAWQAFLSTADSNFWLRIKPAANTVLEVPAGAGTELVGITIQGNPRYIEASVERVSPGGGVARDLDVWVTSTANSFASGSPGEVDNTNYAFALAITETGVLPGGVAIKRKVGTAYWDGSKFASVTPSVGRPSVSSIGAQEAGATVGGDLTGAMPNPTIGPFPAARVLSWGGDTNLYRGGANTLRTDDNFDAMQDVAAGVGGASQVAIGARGAGGLAGVMFGSAGDTNLYRSQANRLKTDDEFWAAGGLLLADGLYSINGVSPGSLQLASAGNITFLQGGVKQHSFNGVYMLFGTAGDTNLYRFGTDILKTDDNMRVVGHLGAQRVVVGLAGADTAGLTGYTAAFESRNYASSVAFFATDEAAPTYPKFRIDNNGIVRWGPGAAADMDTYLYRSSAGLVVASSLRSDNIVSVANAIYSYVGTVAQILLGNNGGIPTMWFGSAADTNLYRASAGTLQTDSQLVVGGNLYARQTLFFGAASDTNLYRSAANVLRTDDQFQPGGGLKLTQTDPAILWPSGFYMYEAGGEIRLIDSAGGGFTSGYLAGHFNLWSDERLKSDIEVLPDPVDKLMAVEAKRHRTQHGEVTKGKTITSESDPTFGFMAQDVQKTMPELVGYDEKTGMHFVDYDRMLPVAWGALQNAVDVIRELRDRVEVLEQSAA